MTKKFKPHIMRIPYVTATGVVFNINHDLISNIREMVNTVREDILAAKNAGKLIAYMSVPISSKGGGHFYTNQELMSVKVKENIEKVFGKKLWVLNPADKKYDLRSSARGPDYMAVWADVLAGPDGLGKDFDMVYFVGPTDVWTAFEIGDADRLSALENWLDDRIKKEPEKYTEIAGDAVKRAQFIRYYGLRGSAAYSKGAHDEWNIVCNLNKKREIGDDIAIYFDGQPIEPGDYSDKIDGGNELLLH